MAGGRAVLRPGDRICFDGAEHQVLGLLDASVRLRNAPPGTVPRDEYDPARRSLTARQQAKAAELGVTARTIEMRRARYAAQGLWGLVDQRATRDWEATGRADARLVEVVREVIAEQTLTSTGTRSRLIRRVVNRVEEIHGPGVVPLPGRTAFYVLVDRLSAGKHTFGSAITRRREAKWPVRGGRPRQAGTRRLSSSR